MVDLDVPSAGKLVLEALRETCARAGARVGVGGGVGVRVGVGDAVAVGKGVSVGVWVGVLVGSGVGVLGWGVRVGCNAVGVAGLVAVATDLVGVGVTCTAVGGVVGDGVAVM